MRLFSPSLSAVSSLACVVLSANVAHAGEHGDFNGDGFDDLVIGAPEEGVGTLDGAGAVNIVYGGLGGLDGTGLILSQNSFSGASPDAGDRFGAVLHVFDLNDDGFDDLAVGVPGESADGLTQCGVIHIFFGSSTGLMSSTGVLTIFEDDLGSPFPRGSGNRFGSSFAGGDFNSDPCSESVLYIGASGVNQGAGRVYGIEFSSCIPGGPTYHSFWDQTLTFGGPEDDDKYGESLVAGDFQGDGILDLVIGVPGESLGASRDGMIQVMRGVPMAGGGTGLVPSDAFGQGTTGVLGAPEDNDRFGTTLAARDVSGDGRADLFIGVPLEDVTPPGGGAEIVNAGAVYVMYGSPAGITPTGMVSYTTDQFGQASQANAQFGISIAHQDLFNDGFADFFIGAPGIDDASGEIYLVLSSFGIYDLWGNGGFQAPVHAPNQQYGASLASGRYDGNNFRQILVGAPGAIGGTDAGAVQMLGLFISKLLIQSMPGVEGAFEPGDRFGETL